MADHSLRGYLGRRSTDELIVLLAYYLQKANYIHVVLEILRLLNDRFVPGDTSESALRVRQLLSRYHAQD